MSTYVIGDLQGCFEPLQRLLNAIEFKSDCDQLWFVGDLVNRGPQSLECLRFVRDLADNAVTVLGNHDIHLLAIGCGVRETSRHCTLDAVLSAPDKTELLQWLRNQPLLHHDSTLNFTMTHAGIFPCWSLEEAKRYASEVEQALSGDTFVDFLSVLFSDQPEQWSETLAGFERLRFIINSFTRMRYCRGDTSLSFSFSGHPSDAPSDLAPWFEVPERPMQSQNIIFGHWSALEGVQIRAHVFANDAGCIWGGELMARCLESGEVFSAR